MFYSKKVHSRYVELKKGLPEDCVLLLQVGTFMQVMEEDARKVGEITGIKLQMVGDIEAPIVIGGFPKSGLDSYIGKLARVGVSVGVAMQDENKERHITEMVKIERAVSQ